MEEPDTAAVTSDSDDSDEAEVEEAPSVVADYPQERVKSLVRNAADAVSTAGGEVVDSVEQAWNRLRTVDEAGLAAALSATPSLLITLRLLIEWTQITGSAVLTVADPQ